MANPPEEITEATFRLTAVNRMSMQRVLLPQVRIQRRCPWEFPASRGAARGGGCTAGRAGRYSRFFRCGYSAGCADGTGNLDGAAPFTWCGYTRADCEARGMFAADAAGHATRRFGGIEFVPPSILVRSYGEKGSHVSAVAANEARYNDFVPLVYGTAWYAPPVVFARNDGNLTHMEVLLGMGEMQGVLKVLVNDVEIPQGQAGGEHDGDGLVQPGERGEPDGELQPGLSRAGRPVREHGVSVGGGAEPDQRRAVAAAGEGAGGGAEAAGVRERTASTCGDEFTNNPAWVLLDVLQRGGWTLEEIDVGSFAAAAAYCEEPIEARDLYGNAVSMPRFQCNLVLQKRRSAADLIRGIRNGARLLLTYGAGGQLQAAGGEHAGARAAGEAGVEQQHGAAGRRVAELRVRGRHERDVGDLREGRTGSRRCGCGRGARRTRRTGSRWSFRTRSTSTSRTASSLADVEDVARTGQEITAPLAALGIANYDQAARILKFQLDKSVRGNTYVEFETSVKGLGLRPGDLIALTYLKEGFDRQPFRVLKVAPGMNYRTVQDHGADPRDAWYTDTNGAEPGGRQAASRDRAWVCRGRCWGTWWTKTARSSTRSARARWSGRTAAATLEADGGVRGAGGAGRGRAPGIPLVSLAAAVGDGGTLPAGQTFYYAVSAVDGEGRESGLSFVVRASDSRRGRTRTRLRCNGLSFAPGTAGFHVYRGTNPAQLLRIATRPGAGGRSSRTRAWRRRRRRRRTRITITRTSTGGWNCSRSAGGDAAFGAATVGNDALEMEENEYRGAGGADHAGQGRRAGARDRWRIRRPC